MKITKTVIDGILIIEPEIHKDYRGWFTESYSKIEFERYGIYTNFIQDNHSMSLKKGTLRGLHYQDNPKAQTKLVRCTRGMIFDVAVDLRKGSKTYGRWIGVELTSENQKQLLIPKGFAHGFVTLCDNVEVQYKVDEYYDPELDRGIRFDDPDISINWGVETPILSEKDKNAPYLKEIKLSFE